LLNNGIHGAPCGSGRPVLSIVGPLNARVDGATANTVRRLVLYPTSTAATTRRTIESSKSIEYGGRDDCHYPNTKSVSAMTDVNVLIIVGVRRDSVHRELTQAAADSSADGITLNTFEGLTDLPRYSETVEDRGTPSAVEALRAAAAEADAVLIVTTYRGRVPTVVHNAIDWLTRRWDQAALHDKPLAVIGHASGCYSGVWSHQSDDADRIAGPRVVESITVSNLGEAIKKLASEVYVGDASSSASSA
jgi:NADPH-dependent FMN reductase